VCRLASARTPQGDVLLIKHASSVPMLVNRQHIAMPTPSDSPLSNAQAQLGRGRTFGFQLTRTSPPHAGHAQLVHSARDPTGTLQPALYPIISRTARPYPIASSLYSPAYCTWSTAALHAHQVGPLPAAAAPTASTKLELPLLTLEHRYRKTIGKSSSPSRSRTLDC
jgi:hypothetical protein